MQFGHFTRYLYFSLKSIVCLLTGLCIYACSFSQQPARSKKSPAVDSFPALKVNIREHLKIFDDNDSLATYRISLCADVPNNKKPLQVAHHQETGHVFLILQKILYSGDTISRVFGFYPRKGLPTLFFKKISSLVKDNSYREYDVEISKELSAVEFDTVLAKAAAYSGRIYHINKFNCYDYALNIFNSVAGENTLAVNYVRFPFIFGKGGSPCSVYKSLQEMKISDSIGQHHIKFANMRAPISTGREK
jgi:hypothetical protein